VDKRFIAFVVLSTGMMLAYITLNEFLAPNRPDIADGPADGDKPRVADADKAKGEGPSKSKDAGKADGQPAAVGKEGTETAGGPDARPAEAADGGDRKDGADAVPDVARKWVTLGHFGSNQPYRLMAILTNRGAAIEKLELVERAPNGRFRFLDLDDSTGYPGYLALVDEGPAGCRIHVVPPGSPAALARCVKEGIEPGLRAGDLLARIDSANVLSRGEVVEALRDSKPGETIQVDVHRENVGTLSFEIELAEKPLALIAPETPMSIGPGPNPPSFRVSLRAPVALAGTLRELAEDPGLATMDWEVVASDPSSVEFRVEIQSKDGKPSLEVRKRFRLAQAAGEPDSDDPAELAYHLEMDLEIRNTSETRQAVAVRWDGPNGLPSEGWWYANKVHPSFFGSAGARDLVWNAVGQGFGIRGARELYQQARGETPDKPVFTASGPEDATELRYAGIDAQYFCVAMLASGLRDGKTLPVAELIPGAAGDVASLDKARVKLTNATFSLGSLPRRLEPGESWSETAVVFAGPRETHVLDAYGIGDILYYGWFPWVAKPLSFVLRAFHFLVGNYGLAIIMLTVVVRAAMFPLSRKAARNAAMMQELAPELRKIAEKHKNDMEKRMAAQKELYARHNFNPFGGCLLMFIQLPIFIGLYRCLSVDIHLRQAPLVPGVAWASNLAGPDQLWRWPLPGFLAGETGFLGPYLNILPIITIVLFLVQQKLFTPPATDEQTRMQQQMMKFMMVFIGVMFFKVPSGLCIYFIASSIWGIAERLLLPKKTSPSSASGASHHSPPRRSGSGDGPMPAKQVRKQRRRW